MNISLTPTLNQFVRRRVRAGRYESASELVREGPRAIQEREKESAAFWSDLRDLRKQPKKESLSRALKALAIRNRSRDCACDELAIKAYYHRNAGRELELCREWSGLDNTWPE